VRAAAAAAAAAARRVMTREFLRGTFSGVKSFFQNEKRVET
jgi:hypothetical protein